MNRQIKFMLNKDVGFNKEQLIVIERADVLGTKMKSFKESYKKITRSGKYSKFNSLPGPNKQH